MDCAIPTSVRFPAIDAPDSQAGIGDSDDGPIAYLTGHYPMASHTFIQREIAALRDCGARIITVSVRYPDAAQLIGDEERSAAAETFYVLNGARSPTVMLQALAQIFAAPRRTAGMLALALRTARPGVRGALWQAFYVIEAAVLAAHLKRHHVRHLHNHFADSSCTLAMLTSRLTGIPFSVTLHGPSDFLEPKSWRLDEKISRAAFVSCISRFARSQAMLFSDPVHWPKLKIVHCGVTPARYRATPTAPREGLRLLFVGRLTAIKGLRVLFEAMAALRPDHPGITLRLVGDGPERAWAEAEAARIGGIEILGFRSQGEVAAALAETDALVLPSFAEGVPVVLMEAMASGRPVIATRVGGVAELVEDGASGLLVAPGDPQALASAILRLAADPQSRIRMGETGRVRVSAEFDVAIEARRLFALFTGRGGKGPRPDPVGTA